MRKRTAARSWVAVAAFVVTSLALVPPASSGVAPTTPPPSSEATVTPSQTDDLLDGQIIDVAGEGFVPSERARIYLCLPRSSPLGCRAERLLQSTLAGPDGSFAVRVQMRFELLGSSSADCRSEECMLFVSSTYLGDDNIGALPHATVPIGFDPSTERMGRMSMTVTPSEDLVEDQTVVVEGEDFEMCGQRTGDDLCDESQDIELCLADDLWEECIVLASAKLEGVGQFREAVRIPAAFEGESGAVDCRVDQCAVYVERGSGLLLLGIPVPIAFAVDDPPPTTSTTSTTGVSAPPAMPVDGVPTFTG